jgi:DNA-binding PadR family transcriptional regulator
MPTKISPPPDEILSGPIKSKTVLPVLVLHILERGPEHGFGLMQRVDEISSGLLATNTNTMYPLLRRLEERGFIDGAWDHPSKRGRRIYSLTPAGRERLARIKADMLPYLDYLTAAVDRLRLELYSAPSHTLALLETRSA